MVEPLEEPAAPEAGVVDEHLYREAELVDLPGEMFAGPGVGEVAGERLGADAVLGPQLLGQLLEALGPACDEHRPVAPARERARDVGADARRGAGDEARGVG